ncbi:MAG: PEP-CTERM sorting domain-containing protein [Verrucomicrobia bacterium]|nr:PEP-CTERM sorting domain-containing protein [Verrucomicrobiota bacterium]
MKKIFAVWATAALAALGTAHLAPAHIGYTNRNFGALLVGAPASSINNQTMSSAFGWADATDADWGDSHRGRFFRFTLTTAASVMVTVQRNASGTGTPGTFLPGISVYSGLAQRANNEGLDQGGTFRTEALAHDGAELSVASRPAGTEGSFRSLVDFSIGNDDTFNTAGDPSSGILIPARLANFTYIGHAADGTSDNFGSVPGIIGDGNADGFVAATFHGLAVGDYSLFVGGANYAAQLAETTSPFPTYGVNVSVQAIPEPSTWALIALGAGFVGWRTFRRRNA